MRYNLTTIVCTFLFLSTIAVAGRAEDHDGAVIATNSGAQAAAGKEKTALPGPSFPVVVRVSAKLFRPIYDTKVDHPTVVKMVVLGARVEGNSRTIGSTSVLLQAAEANDAFLFAFAGQTTSRTVAYAGPAIIYTTTVTGFRSQKVVLYDGQRGFYAQPAQTSSATRSRTDNVRSTRAGLAGRVILGNAWGQVNASRPQAEAIADGETRRQIGAGFDGLVSGYLASLNEKLDIAGVATALLPGEMRDCHVSSQDEHLCLCFRVQGESETAAPPTLSAVADSTSPVQICIHRSRISAELAAALRSGLRAQAAAQRVDPPPRQRQDHPGVSHLNPAADDNGGNTHDKESDTADEVHPSRGGDFVPLERLLGVGQQARVEHIATGKGWVVVGLNDQPAPVPEKDKSTVSSS